VPWDVDDRDAALATRLYVLGMRLKRDKRAFEGERRTLRTAREPQRQGDRGPTLLTRLLCRVETSTMAGMTVWTIRPRGAQPSIRVLYVHGGGYIHPMTADYWRLIRALASAPAEVVVPAYPLAPDATVDDVLPALLEVALSVDADDRPTMLMGDSAGGALVLVMAQRLRDEHRPEPVGVVALCPWLDATLESPRSPTWRAPIPCWPSRGCVPQVDGGPASDRRTTQPSARWKAASTASRPSTCSSVTGTS
jgi:acetyl esterase/lipase